MVHSSVMSFTASVLLATLVGSVTGHSWVEQMQEISADGSFVGPMGYPRSYVARTDPGFNGGSMNYLLPALSSGRSKINDEDLLCHPDQRTAKQSDKYPVLTVKPGAFVAMKYLENGHVTLPANQKGKAKSGGTVFVYGTTSPKDDEKLMDVLKWTQDGKGGDGRGKMIAAQNFDDGRCHQINGETISKERQQEFPDRIPDQPTSNVEQWCETDVSLPTDIDGSKLTVYWVWQWNTEAGIDPGLPNGKDEYYTTCAEIGIGTNQLQGSRKNVADKNTLEQQDPQTKAPEGFQDRTALIKTPFGSANDGASNSPSPSASTSASVPASSPTSSLATETPAPPPSTRNRGRKTRTLTATTTIEEEEEQVLVTVTVTTRVHATDAAPTASASVPAQSTSAQPSPSPSPVASPSASVPAAGPSSGSGTKVQGGDIPRTTLLSRSNMEESLRKTPEELAAEPSVATDAPCEGSATSTSPGPTATVAPSVPTSAMYTSADLSNTARDFRTPGTLVTSISSSPAQSKTASVPRVVLTTALPGASSGAGQIGKEKEGRDEGLIGSRSVRDRVMGKREARRKLGATFPSLSELVGFGKGEGKGVEKGRFRIDNGKGKGRVDA